MTYYLLNDITVTADEARERRARDECGLQEAVRRIQAEKILDALTVLQEAKPDELRMVVHDLIEIVKGIFK